MELDYDSVDDDWMPQQQDMRGRGPRKARKIRDPYSSPFIRLIFAMQMRMVMMLKVLYGKQTVTLQLDSGEGSACHLSFQHILWRLER